MSDKVAFIVGILGQDGFYLRNLLLSKGYTVIGFDRRLTAKHNPDDGIPIFEIDLTSYNEVLPFFKKYNPTHVFNLAGITNVFDPWQNLDELIQSTIILPHNLMKCIINTNTQISFMQASSCLVYGKTKDKIQTETTPRDPIYPYGFSKNYVDQLIKGYREEKGLNFCSAIFYNHDSPMRGNNFFIKKLINFAKEVSKNPNLKITFNNLNIKKDLGYAKDYMEAFVLMGESKQKEDYIVSSGRLVSLCDVVDLVSSLVNFNLFDNIITSNQTIAHDATILYGDHSKITKKLGWAPKTLYEDVVKLIFKNN
jgi:GDPmannose 4,6-dehydratase